MLISEVNLPARAKGASEAYSNTLVLEDCNVINGLVPLIFAKVVLILPSLDFRSLMDCSFCCAVGSHDD